MHSPHSMQPLAGRARAPEERVVGTLLAGLRRRKRRPGVGRNVSPTPMSSATSCMTSSAGVIVGFGTTPSIRSAWS